MIPVSVSRYFDPPTCALLDAYADILTSTGVERGLIGPREIDRIWDRHVLNCAVVAIEPNLVPPDATVADVGSGAGLPGLVWAIVRNDIDVTLIESMRRRTDFLSECITALGLQHRVSVVRGRAEELAMAGHFNVVTARAVAPLTRLVPWVYPLIARPGSLIALKGENAAHELDDAAPILAELGAGSTSVINCGQWLPTPTTVVRVDWPA